MAARATFTRKTGLRDSRLIVIAAEGTQTERKYFEALKSEFRNPRIHVEILSRNTTASSPAHVIKQLDDFRREYSLSLKEDDELWMVIDYDRWGDRKLSQISKKCQQKGYKLLVSNPCFELWLLLHLKELKTYNPRERNRLFKNKNHALEKELRRILGSYNKSNPDISKFIPYVKRAIERAKELDIKPRNRWPQSIGTRVYLLVEEIIDLN